MPKHNTTLNVQQTSLFEKEIPSWESQAGNKSQSCSLVRAGLRATVLGVIVIMIIMILMSIMFIIIIVIIIVINIISSNNTLNPKP